MPLAVDNVSQNARGGSELMKYALRDKVDPELFEKFQIFVSRVHEPLSEDHVRLLWLQDLAGDPENDHLKDGGYNKFHKLIFVSHWQMKEYIDRFNIPWSKCIVIQNTFEPIDFDFDSDKKRDNIRLIYHTTPHRGLQILVPVFQKLREEFPDLELDVFSSFKAYGWDDRDIDFEPLYEACRTTDGINYHGYVPNIQIREALRKSHIFAYPNIWQETSCISLMEAMSSGNIAVHPNYGVLYETASNWTSMYQWDENMGNHANIFYSVLRANIQELISLSDQDYKAKIMIQKSYIDIFFGWEQRLKQWNALLKSLENSPTSLPKPAFVYKTA